MRITAESANRVSMRVNWWIERVCVGLMALLVLDVWLGMLDRYVLPWRWTFTEELARYLMIWMALLAVSSGIAHREHIGVMVIFEKFPPAVRRWLALGFDIVALIFFGYLLIYGIDFVEQGFKRFTMIFAIPKGYPYISVPLAAFFACVQLVLVAVRDFLVYGDTVAGRAEV